MTIRFRLRFACVAALAAACTGLGGCTRQYYFEDLTARYQSPDLPTQFATTGASGFRLSGAIAMSDEGRYIDVARQDTLWPRYGQEGGNQAFFSRPHNDTAALAHPLILEERNRFDRQPVLAAANLAYVRAHWFWGLAAGVGAPDFGCNYLGAYAGYSQLLFGNRIAPTFGGGVFLNRTKVSGRYWLHVASVLAPGEDQPLPGGTTDPPVFQKDTLREARSSVALPFKMGLLYRWRAAFQPYTLVHINAISVLPDESIDPGRYETSDAGFAFGVRNENSIPGMELSFELDFLITEGPLGNMHSGPMATLRVQRKL
jgi:hypothetical protein